MSGIDNNILEELEFFIEDHVDRLARTVAIDITRQLRMITPVDTGFARAGWYPTVSDTPPDYLPIEQKYKNKKKVAPPPIPGLEKVKLGDMIYISNNVPYLIFLDQGHSQQAPAGFIDATVAQVVADYA